MADGWHQFQILRADPQVLGSEESFVDPFSGTRTGADGCRGDGLDPPCADPHGLRYPSDLNDSEWRLIEPAPAGQRGG